jgi:riboflavin kinase / FMN adenylyltransferase
MKTYNKLYNELKNQQPITLTMGNFDGLHIGHQQLIKTVKSYSDTKHAVLTFDPHPSQILRKQNFRTLTSAQDKEKLLMPFDLDFLFIVQFNHDFSKLSVNDFIIFLKSIAVKRIIIGRDARFAYRGEGNIEHLKTHFEVVVIDDMLYNYTRVSTTYIKDLLDDANLGQVRKLLKRNYTIKGHIVHGNSIGKKLGFPTANIDFDHYFMPKNGVYYVKVLLNQKVYHAMANIGNNPTLNFTAEKRLEVYILDFSQDIYGELVEIQFCYYIRAEKKFENKDALIEQLKKDEQTIRNLAIS